MPLIQPDHRHYTYADYSSWPDDVRYELIDGVAYLMSPAPTLDHQDVVGEVYRQLANALEGQTCRAYVSPPWTCGFPGQTRTTRTSTPLFSRTCW